MNEFNYPWPGIQPVSVDTVGNAVFMMGEESLQTEYLLVALFCNAIATFEGFYKEGSISQRHNNPGNIRPIGSNEGFRTFETPLQGWAALQRQVLININRGLTLREFFLGKPGVYPGYTPLGPGTGNTEQELTNYIAFVSKRMNVPENVDLRRYFPTIAHENHGYMPEFYAFWTYHPFYLNES